MRAERGNTGEADPVERGRASERVRRAAGRAGARQQAWIHAAIEAAAARAAVGDEVGGERVCSSSGIKWECHAPGQRPGSTPGAGALSCGKLACPAC
jgi:hypothetical protein